jgi:hypothetical protein
VSEDIDEMVTKRPIPVGHLVRALVSYPGNLLFDLGLLPEWAAHGTSRA